VCDSPLNVDLVQGGARAQFHALREEVVACLALVEALIDFGEGEDLEEGVFAQGNVYIRCFSGRVGSAPRLHEA